MEDILALILIFGGGTCIALAFSPLGRALADRIRPSAGANASIAGAVEHDPAIWEELDRLRVEMSELQERVEFSERLLAKDLSSTSVSQ